MGSSAPRTSEGVAALLAPFEPQVLDQHPSPVCALTAAGAIVYVNPAWICFGSANGGPATEETCGVGANVLHAAPPVLRAYYERMFSRALGARLPAEHDYECSSPQVLRVFRMRVHPLESGLLVITHSLQREVPHDRPVAAALDELYRDARGMIVQCSCCRRVRRPDPASDEQAVWEWVPAFVEATPARTSHGLCVMCLAYYYSE